MVKVANIQVQSPHPLLMLMFRVYLDCCGMCMCVCVCVCVCVCDRERESRRGVCLCLCVVL